MPQYNEVDNIKDAISKYGPIQDRWIIRLGKEDGEFEPWHLEADTFEDDLKGFLDALSLSRSVLKVESRMRQVRIHIKDAKKKEREAAKAAKLAAEKLAKAEAKAVKKAQKAQDKADDKAQKEQDKAVKKELKCAAKIKAKAELKQAKLAAKIKAKAELKQAKLAAKNWSV